ncbi:right-handed parallel beta-helix repeat-containing protein [Roseateles amylovorans]|uniref:pectin lyase n=1 Tax=Roseateles amylovorans TaxID=2978473 RepID=A0ABY6AV22_9BURK|nr:right-handed parallel beta-helix repeat-containing protein [Roseateles amylovorans]UXH76425.1 hypothetical protein N4261_15305 [Roseateles amylovorans]
MAEHTLTIQPPSNGTIAGATSGSTYAAGAKVVLTAVTDGTYGVDKWLGDAAECGSALTCTVKLDANKSVGLKVKTVPVGFGAGVTGGAGGEVVDVSTPAQLKSALCDRYNGSTCIDSTPRVIRVLGVIDFINTEGSTTGKACAYSSNNCAVNGKQEKILDWNSYCSGRQLFDLTYDTAGGTPLRVGSNKTIVGVGKNAGIKGKGFYLRDGVSNIIIRNLSLTDINDGVIWGGDAITIDGASDVWIDHNYFARIGRQMIVTGWGPADRVTISNNVLDGTTDYGHFCDGRSYWFMLLIAEGQTITIIGNKIYNSSGRSPEVGRSPWATQYGMVHLVNNLYDNNFWMGIAASENVVTLIEGNDFTPTNLSFYPVWRDDSSLVIAPHDTNISAANGYCKTLLSRDCARNSASNSTVDFVINQSAVQMMTATSAWAKGAAGIQPIPASQVRNRVMLNAGPQADPDL